MVKFSLPDAYTADGRRAAKTERTETLSVSDVPSSFSSNSVKEALCLEYVDNFSRDFSALFPARRPLYLAPKNECGIRKFVVSSLRPTQLPHKELYELSSCASFLAHFLHYETVEKCLEPPEVLPSSSQVLKWGLGDAFDFSMLLCSYLLGVGYDAYVVYGTAPRWVCVKDQSNLQCPLQESIKAEEEQEAKADDAEPEASSEDVEKAEGAKTGDGVDGTAAQAAPETLEGEASSEKGDEALLDDAPMLATRKPYQAESRGVRESTYLKDMEERRKREQVNPPGDWDSAGEECQEDPVSPESQDPLHGQRVHAWVLVRSGKRDVESSVFVEASTGRILPVDDSPFLSVEAAWNHKNYWVNMQPSEVNSVKGMSFDFANRGEWEFVLMEDDAENAALAGAGDEASNSLESHESPKPDVDTEEENDTRPVLEKPPSWVTKLDIPRESFDLRYPPEGRRTIIYKRAKLELFTPNRHPHGMVQKITTFVDNTMTVVKEVREEFLNRRDKLKLRRRFPLEAKVHEYFLPGRSSPQPALKEQIEWQGHRRVLTFYVEARLDGLYKCQEEIGTSIEEFYEGRADRLYQLSVSFVERKSLDSGDRAESALFMIDLSDMNQLAIVKMTEKYHRNPSLQNANEDVAKRTFYVRQGLMKEQFHYAEGRITRATKSFPTTLRTTNPAQTAGDMPSIQVQQMQQQVEAAAAAEKNCVKMIKDHLDETNNLLRQREDEEADVALDLPIFDLARERQFSNVEAEQQGSRKRQNKGGRFVDYLTPFLPEDYDGKLSREKAQQARDACLHALKERLLERANIIQNRLNEEKAELSKRQAIFHRGQSGDPEAEREFEEFCLKTTFRIQILDQRLTQHEDHALQKYADLDRQLSADPRLKVLAEG